MQENLLIVKDVVKQYGDYLALNKVNISVPKGSIYGLLGPNGAGKTTTLRMLLGQSPRTSGVLSIFGKSIDSNLREIRQRTGIVPQADNLDPDFQCLKTCEYMVFTFGSDPCYWNTAFPSYLNWLNLITGQRIAFQPCLAACNAD